MTTQSINVKATVNRILRKRELSNFSDEDQAFLKDMHLRLKTSTENRNRLLCIVTEVNADIVYRGDALLAMGVTPFIPPKNGSTKCQTPKSKGTNKGKYRHH